MGLISEMLKLPLWLQVWIFWMGVVNMASLFFWKQREARWIFTGFAAAFLVMNTLYAVNGYNRLLGLAHLIGWTPPLAYLLLRWKDQAQERLYRAWLSCLVATNGLSLVIDLTDVVRYALGERA